VDRLRTEGPLETEIARARRQLRARLVFENDSVTNIAHQLGYFDTVTGPGFYRSLQDRVGTVTPEQVASVAARRLVRDQCTVGWFKPSEKPS
jgi:predicted Zn-dependent peptidase